MNENAQVFTHVVLTRFNVRLEDRAPATEQWLRDRLRIMRATLLPSMRAQSVRPSAWLVLCDGNSPEWFRSEIEKDLIGVGCPIWLDEPFSSSLVANIVRGYVNSPYLITTRIDNDDAVALNFIERVQAEFSPTPNVFINFIHGAQYEEGWIFHRSDPANAFISMIEDAQSVRTVFIDWHNRLGAHGIIRQVRTSPMWLQVVHGSNIANSTHGVRANPSMVQNFKVDLPIRSVGSIRRMMLASSDAFSLGLRVLSKPHRLLWLFKTMFSR